MLESHPASLHPTDRPLAILAHLSGLAGYVVPLGGALVPLLMMVLLSDRPVVARIAKQALYLNIAVFLAAGGLFLLWFTILLIPVAAVLGLLLTPIAVLLPMIGALKAAQGEAWSYPWVGVELHG